MKQKKTYLIYGAVVIFVLLLSLFVYLKLRGLSCKSKILFLGDSNTAGSWSYADKVISFCGSSNMKKIAKVGAKTSWMLSELQNELNKNDYDAVVILSGSNDIFGSLSIDSAKTNMNNMLELIKSKGAKSIVINPPSKKYYSNTTNQHKQLILDWTFFLKNHKLPYKFIDFESITEKDRSLFAGDMIHINSKGHQLLADQFINDLNLKNV